MAFRHEVKIEFWRLVVAGSPVKKAADAVAVSHTTGKHWFRNAGGMIPKHLLSEPAGWFMDYQDRAAIAVGREQGLSIRAIAERIGRSPTTVMRELNRNTRRGHKYHAHRAQVRTEDKRTRYQPSKLVRNPQLREYVQSKLDLKWSPEQIRNRLVEEYPGEETMRISHETIYRAVYVQARGSLKREVEAKLRTGRSLRKPRAKGQQDGRGQRPDLPRISARPPEVEDRAIPGHWEGDLIVGADGKSQIGTLVERTTRFCMLLHLPTEKDTTAVEAEMVRAIRSLPGELMKTLTWDRGTEMTGAYQRIETATDLKVFFCDPHSPWQRGSNENTNGLLRQYFPKGTDLSAHSRDDLDFVQAELNGRPRKALGWQTPTEALRKLLLNPQNKHSVAVTP